MSHFSETLQALMALHEPALTQQDLSVRTGISQATISRLLASREPTREQVGQLCTVISDDRARRVELLLADLRDRAAAAAVAGIDERHFVLGPSPEDMPETIRATGSLAAELQMIADECSQHDDVRSVVSELSRMILRHRAELIDAGAEVYPFPEHPSAAAADQLLDSPTASREHRSASKAARTDALSSASKKHKA